MSWQIGKIVFVPHPAEWQQFTSGETGPVGRYLFVRGMRLRAMAQASVGKKSGRLGRSITVTYHRGPTNPYVDVGSDLSYAYDHHEGTNPHVIFADPGRLLRFKQGGKIVYAQRVDHPGTRANKYLTKHLRRVVND